jgi:hypothetical protein
MVAQTFEHLGDVRYSATAAVHRGLSDRGRQPSTPDDSAIASDKVPVPGPLNGLLPDGFRRGDVVALDCRDCAPETLALALLAGALGEGLWCAAVGVPELGVLAVAELLGPSAEQRAALDRLMLVPDPAARWAEVVTALADGVDLLLARPTIPVSAQVARRVDARLRQGRSEGTRHSAVLLVLGTWSTARLTLRTAETQWTGLDGIGPSVGTGHLTGGRAVVIADGRATAGRPRTTRLWLPAVDGSAQPLTDAGQEPARLHPVA